MTDPITIDKALGYAKLVDLDQQAAEITKEILVARLAADTWVARCGSQYRFGSCSEEAIGSLVVDNPDLFGVAIVMAEDRVDPAPETKRSAK